MFALVAGGVAAAMILGRSRGPEAGGDPSLPGSGREDRLHRAADAASAPDSQRAAERAEERERDPTPDAPPARSPSVNAPPGPPAPSGGSARDGSEGDDGLSALPEAQRREIERRTRRDMSGLVPVQHPDGSTSIDLEGRFQHVPVGRVNEDGTITIEEY